MKTISDMLKLCLLVGRSDCTPHSMFDVIASAIKGGITSVQLRDKDASESDLAKIGKQTLKILPDHIPLIINDHVEVAKYLGVGLHIGQSDMHYRDARRYLGSKKIIGLSIGNSSQAEEFKDCDADYFGIGPIYKTKSKPNASPPIGICELQQIIKILNPMYCVAIGGINSSNAHQVYSTGIGGIAVISAITKSSNPELAAKDLIEKGNYDGCTTENLSNRINNCRIR